MYQFQPPQHDDTHIPLTRLQVQEQSLYEKKFGHGRQTVPVVHPRLPQVIEAVRVRMGNLLITVGTLLAGSRPAGASGPALATRR